MFRQLYAHLMKELAKKKGFTMIELLVVISIIGILAVAVLSTLNPIEQLNRGRDTRTRADAAELLGGIERYYATREEYPWNTGATGAAAQPTSLYTFDGRTAAWTWAQQMVTANEVKTSLITRVDADNKHYVFKLAGNAAITYVCFLPTSTSFQAEAAKNCSNGTTPGGTGSTVTPPTGAPGFCATAGQQWLCLP